MHYPPLTAQALRYLQQLQQRLNASGSERVKTHTKSVQDVLRWCTEHELVPANSLQLPQFSFDLPLLKAIAATQRQLQQACFQDEIQQQSRLDNALVHQQELKSLGPSPRQHRVLVKLNNPIQSTALPTITFTDIDWQQLPLSNYDALLVVENLDCFYQLERFNLALLYQQPLIIYRGDKLYSKGCKALKTFCFQQNKPILYFGDFDAKGVSIALNEDYSAILLPELTTLQQQASTAMLPNTQLSFIAGISEHTVAAAFLPYQQLLCQQLVGLRQQNMQSMRLKPISIR
ncbi:hypothetical protein GCM10010919_03500 [Alishewanella longhuensis]|uniref:DUF7281 domain-containing protein n=1 Tax=Alishewanella longhuensis TaxID=1091037 RepID=A0ABQ3KVJ4_9ALTE|nr:Wadjet anti-phage system protein JetD domain-containing protein [Alishewanella longhuensis]GHG60224.1 hypothetical protein GCM10010919_03500 [Alishewanella longhuensis]